MESTSASLSLACAGPSPQEALLAPYALARVCGFACSELKRLRAPETLALIAERAALRTASEALVGPLCDAIAAAVPHARDGEQRRALVNLRRSIFNDRRLDVHARELALARGALPAPRARDLANLCDHQACIRLTNARLEETYRRETHACRQTLQTFLRESASFHKGVQLSSPTLTRTLARYLTLDLDLDPDLALPSGDGKISKSQAQAEQTLMAFLARMATKPTPFADLTALVAGTMDPGSADPGSADPGSADPGSAPLTLQGDFRAKVRSVRLSRGFARSFEPSLVQDPHTKGSLLVRLNDTYSSSSSSSSSASSAISSPYTEDVFFVRGKDGTAGAFSQERFVELPRTPVLDCITQLLSQGRDLTWQQLTTALSTATGASEPEAAAVLERLEQVGFLAVDLGIPDQVDDYLAHLIAVLDKISSPLTARCLPKLRQLQLLERRFGPADAPLRATLLRQIDDVLAALATDTGSPKIASESVKTVVYEDVAHVAKFSLRRQRLTPLVEELGLLQRLLPLLDAGWQEKSLLANIFLAHQDQGATVDLLDFYRQFRQLSGDDLNRMWQQTSHHGISGAQHTQRQRAQATLAQHLRLLLRKNPAAPEVVLTRRWVEQFVAALPEHVKPWHSAAHYCQMTFSGDAPRLVWNRSGLGHGKHFSRYCHLFDLVQKGAFADSLRTWLHRNGGGAHADLLGVLGINVNLHPPLLAHEIVYPGCIPQPWRRHHARPLGDLCVRYEGESHRLQLWSKSLQKPLQLVPQGFLFPLLAPQLYRFLCKFAATQGSQSSFWSLVHDAVPAAPTPATPNVSCYPRLRIDRLVVERASWRFTTSALPMDKKGSAFFQALNDFRLRHGLPLECFVKRGAFTTLSLVNMPSDDLLLWVEKARNTRTRKPMYLDFANPLLVDVLRKQLGTDDDAVVVQEFLPTRADAAKLPFSGRVSEFLFEVDLHGAHHG